MSTYIQYEIWLFLQSFVLGAGLLLFYRLIRVIRRLFSRSSAYSGLFDILYWLVLTMLVFARIYQTNQGILRNFLFFGLLSGAFFTYLTLASAFELICYKILEIPVRFMKKFSKKLSNRLLFWGKSCKILARQSANRYKNSTRNPLQTKKGRKVGKIREKTKKKTIGYNQLGMFGISLIVLVLLLSLMVQSRDLKESLAGYETRAEALSQQLEEEQARTEEIKELKEYMQTDEYAEQAAREKLGLVKDNEIIFQEAN